MSARPWMKFYPSDWRADQSLRIVSLAARGLWIECLCIMHEAPRRGHLLIGSNPVSNEALARAIGATEEEVRDLINELLAAGVCDRSRDGVILSRRMVSDEKRSKQGRNDKLEALGKYEKKPRPSRGASRPPSSPPTRGPSSQRPEAREEVEGHKSPSTLFESAKDIFEMEKDPVAKLRAFLEKQDAEGPTDAPTDV